MRRCKIFQYKKIECDAVTNQILQNAFVRVQGLWFIKNRERFSPKDDRKAGNINNGSNHILCFAGFGVDDFQSDDKRVTSIFKFFEQKWLMDDPKMFFLNVGEMSRLMNERYSDLRKKIPRLSNERHIVTFQSSRSKQKITWFTNLY
jgi:hypothetical protein